MENNEVIEQPLDYVKIEPKKSSTDPWLFAGKYFLIGLCIVLGLITILILGVIMYGLTIN